VSVVLTFPDGRCEIFEASVFFDNSAGYTIGNSSTISPRAPSTPVPRS
jgi:hypothetical protein